tara:strand:- start:577 stop:738 length:162 start_codon:yes stop_codon:yes gene_type:complete
MKGLLKVEKKDFTTDQDYYSFIWKKKYKIEFNKFNSDNIKLQLKTLIKKFDKK